MSASSDDSPRPSPLVAAALGVVAPGAGLLYAGRWRLALGVLVVYLAAAATVPLVVIERGLDVAKLPEVIRAASLSLWVPALVFGVIAAVTSPPSPPAARAWWRHPWWLLGFVLAVHAGSSIVRGQIGARVVTVVVVEQQLPRLGLDPPAAFVVVRRGFDPTTLVPGELVAADVEGRARIARVVGAMGAPARALSLDLGSGEVASHPVEVVLGRAVPSGRRAPAQAPPDAGAGST